MERAQRGQHLGAEAAARGGGVGRVLAPGQPARLAVRGGLLARRAEQRPDQPAVARGHAQQRAPAGRGGEPVEHGLHLVGRGVAGGDVARREPRGLGVAGVARPGLDVAGRRGGAADVQRARRAARTARRSAPRRRRPRRAGRSCSAAPRPWPASRTATSSRQTESRPPERSTSTGRSGTSSPPARTRSSRSRSSAMGTRTLAARGNESGGASDEVPAAMRAMRPAASAGGVRDVRDALRRTTALHFPTYCLGWCRKVYRGPRGLSTPWRADQTTRWGYSSSSIAR